MTFLDSFFEVCPILAEKQWLEPKKLNFLKDFASLDTQFDPQVARLVKIYPILHFVLKFDNSSAIYIFFLIFKVIPEVYLLHLMAIFQALLLINKLDHKNSKLLQPFIS